MKQTLISIIVPIYKVELYLGRCLDSIVNQTYTNLEIILVDDGSPDNCPQICDEYAAMDDRIKVIHKENGGLSDARNAGLDCCTGEYISFVDGDDVISHNAIQLMVENVQNDEFDIVIANIQRFTDDEEKYLCKQPVMGEVKIYSSLDLLTILCKNSPVYLRSVCGKLFNKALFNKLRFLKGKLYEDMFINYRLFYNAKSCLFIDTALYRYRYRKGSIMDSTVKSTFAIEADEMRFDFLKKHNKIEIAKLCLPSLCWDYLLLYAQKQHGAKAKFLYYAKEYFSHKPTVNTHYFLLRIFALVPFLYRFLRALSPWHIREQ